MIIILVIGCDTSENTNNEIDIDTNWRDIPFKDVNSGKMMTVSDFSGKPILIHIFALWCPNCWRLDNELKELKGEVELISFDTEPTENETQLKEYVDRFNFGWYFANPPPELTISLINEIGIEAVSPKYVPILLVCEDQSARLLGKGMKTAEVLREEIEKGCN